MDAKELLKETLDFYKYKLDHGCTMEDIETAARWAAENINALGTAEDFAKEDVAKMYYTDASGNKKSAPYWTDEQVREVYSAVRDRIPSDYNEWDFYVTLNMMKADNCTMLREWFPEAGADDMEGKLVEMAINWLNDGDNPYGGAKIWRYLNPAK